MYGLTAESFNFAIRHFNKTADRLSKHEGLPVPNCQKHSFKVKLFGAQFRTLVTNFGLILNRISCLKSSFFKSQRWHCFALFQRIVSFLFSPTLVKADAITLQTLISQFLKLFVSLYRPKAMKPKFHHLVHYPAIIIQYGPSRYSSTACHERGLRRVKPHVLSKKNPCKQIAEGIRFQTMSHLKRLRMRHQELMAVGKPWKKKHAKGLPPHVCETPNNCRYVASVRYKGTFYASGLAVCLSMPEKGWLQTGMSLAIIRRLFVSQNQLYLIIEHAEFLEFDNDLLAVRCTPTGHFEVIVPTQLPILKTFPTQNFKFFHQFKPTRNGSTYDIRKSKVISKIEKSMFVTFDALPIKFMFDF